MKEVFVNNSLSYLKNNNVCNSSQESIFKYTLETLYSFFTKSLVIVLLSILFKTFGITFMILFLYSILRGFTFGIHATKNIYCWLISLTVYIICPFIIKYYTFPVYYIYSIFILGILFILLWAPADTKARPLLNKKKRIVNKFISFTLSICLISLSILLNNQNFKEIITIILLLNSICICPFTYFIFKQTYKNYRFYKS